MLNNNYTIINYQNYLDMCGVKHSRLGFKYLMTVFMILDAEADKKIRLSDIYERVAEIYDSSPKNVEKAIYYAVKHHGITNKEFIYKAIDDNFVYLNSKHRVVRPNGQIKLLV